MATNPDSHNSNSLRSDEVIPETWGQTLQGVNRCEACGLRDVLIIKANEILRIHDIEPRKNGILTQEDEDMLAKAEIPQDCWNDDAKIMAAKYSKDKRFNVLQIEDDPDMTAEYAMDKIKTLLKTTKKPGVEIIYFGSGRKRTGDWCFKDGYINFHDIMELYDTYFTGKHLTIVTDCSYSGTWVQLAMDHLDKLKITFCLHSARASSKIMDVFSSCQSGEIPSSLMFTTRAFYNDKNNGKIICKCFHQVAPNQNVRWCGNSMIGCKSNSLDSECLIPPDYTFMKKRKAERLLILQGSSEWYLFLAIDDDDIIHQIYSGQVNLIDFCGILDSGSGNITEHVKTRIEREYPGHRINWKSVF